MVVKNFPRSTHRAKHVVPGRPAGAASTSPGKLRARVMRSTATYYGDPDPSTEKESGHFSPALHGWHEFHVRADSHATGRRGLCSRNEGGGGWGMVEQEIIRQHAVAEAMPRRDVTV